MEDLHENLPDPHAVQELHNVFLDSPELEDSVTDESCYERALGVFDSAKKLAHRWVRRPTTLAVRLYSFENGVEQYE